MDGQLVAPTDAELKKLTDRFVCVRLIQMGGVDLTTFQFDPFLSWAVFFMNGDKTIYGRFGRAHPKTKRNQRDSNPSHTRAGLVAAMGRALELHDAYTKEPAAMSKALAGKTGPKPRWRFTEKNPAARKYKRLKRIKQGGKGCVHCHNVQRTRIDSYIMKRIPIPDKMLWMYPRPHVLGLDMDNRACARVGSVKTASVAEAAGIAAGDELISMHGQPLVSIADIQWVLHSLPDDGGDLTVELRRGGKLLRKTMRLAPGWRRAEDWVWRYRVAGYSSWMWAGVSFEDSPKGVRVANRAPRWFKKANAEPKRKLQKGDVLVEVDGRTDMDRSALLAYLMRDKKLGSTVNLVVLRNGKRMPITFKIPKKQPEVQGG